ncbi:32654_t:CDS:2, partial [Gigaspora margarita]
NTIQDMIQNDVIQSTMPDPLYEPEPYAAIVANQIHTCNEKCRRPNLIMQMCKKGFLRPYSESTHYEEATVKYLTTDPPPIRTRSVLPVHMIDENDENSYYNDTIMKYMHRSRIPEFENLTYPQYFKKYSVTPSCPTSRSIVHRDELFNYVVKCKKEIIIKYHQLKIDDGELYFYQQLLLNQSARSEADYKSDSSQTYQDKFLLLHPTFLSDLQNQTANTHYSRLTNLNN